MIQSYIYKSPWGHRLEAPGCGQRQVDCEPRPMSTGSTAARVIRPPRCPQAIWRSPEFCAREYVRPGTEQCDCDGSTSSTTGLAQSGRCFRPIPGGAVCTRNMNFGDSTAASLSAAWRGKVPCSVEEEMLNTRGARRSTHLDREHHGEREIRKQRSIRSASKTPGSSWRPVRRRLRGVWRWICSSGGALQIAADSRHDVGFGQANPILS